MEDRLDAQVLAYHWYAREGIRKAGRISEKKRKKG